MARTVGDAALMLDAMVGYHPADPISLPAPRARFVSAVDDPIAPRRIAVSKDLGGLVPVSGEISDIFDSAVAKLADLGVVLEEACPDLNDTSGIFDILRASYIVGDLGEIVADHADRLKTEIVQNFRRGLDLTVEEVAAAERARGAVYERVSSFFSNFDLLVTPATIVAPFDIDIRWVEEVGGHKFENFYDWYAISYAISVTSLPAMSLPYGFTASGLPVGLQLVGPPRGERRLLGAAKLMEDLFGVCRRLPIDPIES